MLLLAALATLATSGTADGEVPETQLWQSDVTDSMAIGASLTGYRSVSLRCGADHMLVAVELEEDFDGVLYTRGAFHSREEPCFLDAQGGRNFSLRLPFDRCNTRDDDKMYSNTIVVQNDDELIMPGDAAFQLECNFREPKDYVMSAGLRVNRERASSRISVEDADPAAKDTPKDEHHTASSDSSTVTFIPSKIVVNKKDEL